MVCWRFVWEKLSSGESALRLHFQLSKRVDLCGFTICSSKSPRKSLNKSSSSFFLSQQLTRRSAFLGDRVSVARIVLFIFDKTSKVDGLFCINLVIKLQFIIQNQNFPPLKVPEYTKLLLKCATGLFMTQIAFEASLRLTRSQQSAKRNPQFFNWTANEKLRNVTF